MTESMVLGSKQSINTIETIINKNKKEDLVLNFFEMFIPIAIMIFSLSSFILILVAINYHVPSFQLLVLTSISSAAFIIIGLIIIGIRRIKYDRTT